LEDQFIWEKISSGSKRVQIEIQNRKQESAKEKTGSKNDREFRSETNTGKFRSIAAFQDKIAIGADSAIIVVSKDTIFRIKSDDIGSVTSIEFDPSGQLFVYCNTFGTLCRISMTDFSTDFNHTPGSEDNGYRIQQRTDPILATASYDNTVGVWDMKSNWTSLTPLLFPSPYIQTNSYCLPFDDKNEYVLAGYWKRQTSKMAC
jgi:WD40 repeat protein